MLSGDAGRDHSSWAGIVNNTVRLNDGDGITVNDNSSARVGFIDGQASVASPNTIDRNGRGGITVGDGPGAFLSAPNSGVNAQNGVRCRLGGVVSAAIGTLTGLNPGSAVNVSTDCATAITP